MAEFSVQYLFLQNWHSQGDHQCSEAKKKSAIAYFAAKWNELFNTEMVISFLWDVRHNPFLECIEATMDDVAEHCKQSGKFVWLCQAGPSRGPGNHYRAALSQPMGVWKGGQWGLWGTCPPPQKKIRKIFFRQLSGKIRAFSGKYHKYPTKGLGERRKAENDFMHISGPKEAIWNTLFSIFEWWWDPLNAMGPGKTFPLSSLLGGPGVRWSPCTIAPSL